jgi:hypothetical protein
MYMCEDHVKCESIYMSLYKTPQISYALHAVKCRRVMNAEKTINAAE